VLARQGSGPQSQRLDAASPVELVGSVRHHHLGDAAARRSGRRTGAAVVDSGRDPGKEAGVGHRPDALDPFGKRSLGEARPPLRDQRPAFGKRSLGEARPPLRDQRPAADCANRFEEEPGRPFG